MSAAAKIQKNKWKYTEFSDLVSSQIEITRLSYDTHSKEYAENWEWNQRAKDVTLRDYMSQFMEIAPVGVVLVVGCGTGRDLDLLESKGYRYLGIDTSEGMLEEAIGVRKISGPVIRIGLENISLVDNSFDGILVDSAVEHIRKAEMEEIVEKLYKGLRKGGACMLRFRLGTGLVFVVEDVVGTRYFCSYTREQANSLVTRNGFKVVKEYSTEHLEKGRPGFLTYILRK